MNVILVWLCTSLLYKLLFWLMWWYLLSLDHSAKRFDWFSNVPILRPFFVGSAPRLTPYRSPEGGGARELSPADAVSLPGATTKAPLQAWKPVWSFPLHREELGCNKLYGFPRRGFASEWMRQSRIESSPAYQAKLHVKQNCSGIVPGHLHLYKGWWPSVHRSVGPVLFLMLKSIIISLLSAPGAFLSEVPSFCCIFVFVFLKTFSVFF